MRNPEDAGADLTYHAGCLVTISRQLGEVEVAEFVQILLHAVNDRMGSRLRDTKWGDVWRQCLRDRVFRVARIKIVDFATPITKFALRNGGVANLIDNVVHFAAKRVERSNGPPTIGRQEAERVVEA